MSRFLCRQHRFLVYTRVCNHSIKNINIYTCLVKNVSSNLTASAAKHQQALTLVGSGSSLTLISYDSDDVYVLVELVRVMTK